MISSAGLESPEEYHAAVPAAADPRDLGQVSEHPTPTEKAAGRGGGGTAGTVPVHQRPSSSGVDISRQMAKRTEAFEQLSAFLQ